MKIAPRPGDAAPMALLELIPDENSPSEPKPAPKGKDGKESGEAKAKGKTKESAAGEPKPKPKAKSGSAAPKVKKDAGARVPTKSAATMKRSGRSSGK